MMAMPGEIVPYETPIAPELTPEEESLLKQAEEREEKGPEPPPDEHPSAETAPRGYVPAQALKEARDEAVRFRAELQQRREMDAALSERLRIFQEQRAEEDRFRYQQTVQPPPDPNEDPLGYQEYRTRQLEAEVNHLRQTAFQAQQQTQAVNTETQQAIVLQRLQTEEAQLVQSHSNRPRQDGEPSYAEDYQLVREAWADQFRAMGFNEQQVEWQLQQGQALISQACLGYRQDGSFGYVRNPGQSVSEMAERIRQTRGMSSGNGSRQSSPRFQQIRRGQAAASSLSSVGGQSGRMVNAQTLKNMSTAEFNKFYADNPELVDKIIRNLEG